MPNNVIHFEVTGQDGEVLQKFFGELFDWKITTDNPVNYGLVDTADEGAIGGGIGATGDSSPGMTTFYVGVDDVAAYLDRAAGLGGEIVMPETTVMEDVTIGLFADPEGHVVGLVKAAS